MLFILRFTGPSQNNFTKAQKLQVYVVFRQNDTESHAKRNELLLNRFPLVKGKCLSRENDTKGKYKIKLKREVRSNEM